MLHSKRVLLAVDTSEASRRAAAYVAEVLGGATGCHVGRRPAAGAHRRGTDHLGRRIESVWEETLAVSRNANFLEGVQWSFSAARICVPCWRTGRRHVSRSSCPRLVGSEWKTRNAGNTCS